MSDTGTPKVRRLKCSVAMCSGAKIPGISLHRFPKNEKLRHEWISRCKRNDTFSITYARVCSLHFLPADYVRDLKNELLGLPVRNILNPDAVPSQLIPNWHGDKVANASKCRPTPSVPQPVPSARERRQKTRTIRKRALSTLRDLSPKENKKFSFRGLMAPVLTPFANDKNFSVRLDVITEYAKYLSSIGIDAVLVNGTSGEGPSMTVAERKAVTEAWAAAVKQTKQILMVQVGGACLKDVQELATHAEKVGSDGLLCLPELYFKPTTEEDLVRYLKHVGEAAPKTPLLYYHIPSFTGVKVSMPKFLAAAARDIPTFAGVKFTDTNLDEASQCLLVENGSLAFFLGCDQVLAGAFTLGIDSAIATTLNMIPSPSIKMKEAIKNNRPDQALEQQKKLNKAISAMTLNGTCGWVPTMKVAMDLLTPLEMGPPRPPLLPLTNEQKQKVKKDLIAQKLIN